MSWQIVNSSAWISKEHFVQACFHMGARRGERSMPATAKARETDFKAPVYCALELFYDLLGNILQKAYLMDEGAKPTSTTLYLFVSSLDKCEVSQPSLVQLCSQVNSYKYRSDMHKTMIAIVVGVRGASGASLRQWPYSAPQLSPFLCAVIRNLLEPLQISHISFLSTKYLRINMQGANILKLKIDHCKSNVNY